MISTLFVLLSLAGAPISIEFRGTLGEALNQIATKGDLNLIATGDLHTPAEVHFKEVSAEDALETLARVHHLDLHKSGKLWIVKPAEKASDGPLAGKPLLPALPPPPGKVSPPTPPTPPTPPEPLLKGHRAFEFKFDGKDLPLAQIAAEAKQRALEEVEKQADEAERVAERMREAADKHAEVAEAKADALRDQADKLRDQLEAEAEKESERESVVVHAEEHERKMKSHKSKKVATGSIAIDDGEIVDDIVAYGGSVTLGDGAIAEGDVVAFGGDVVLGDGAVINGDAVSFGGTIHKGDGATIGGEEVSFGAAGFGVKPLIKAVKSDNAHKEPHHGGGIAAFLVNFAAFFGLGFLLMMFVPNRMKNIEAEIKNQPVKSGIAGILAMIGAIPLTVLLCITLIGIPVAVLMWLAGGLALVMGMLALANTVGGQLPLSHKRRTQAVVLAVGLFLMSLVALVPVVGPLIIFLATCVSFGAIIRTRVGQRSPAGLPMPETGVRQVTF